MPLVKRESHLSMGENVLADINPPKLCRRIFALAFTKRDGGDIAHVFARRNAA